MRVSGHVTVGRVRGARPCSRVRSRGPLALLGSVSARRVMDNCTYCPGKCEWYRERVRAARERLRRGWEKGDENGD